jgi:hypothetical protein
VRKTTIYLYVLGLAVVIMAALVSTGVVATAQNANSATTMTNAEAPKKAARRHKPKAAASGRCDPMKQEQTDLSGTYTGKVNYPDASLTGDATLTITGNNFTLTAGSSTQSGRVTAVTTCGYTGVTMMFGDLTPPTPGPNPRAALPAVSLRAKKMGDRVTLATVPGEARSFSFSSGGGMKGQPRKRKPKAKPEATPTPPPPKQ